MINLFRAFLATSLAVLLGACSHLPAIPDVPLLTPYRIEVQQGNVTTQEMVSSLKPGMSKDQVKFILGTPLLTDMFHGNRWDYVYRLQRGRGGAKERRITLYFENDVLARIEGDVVAQPAQAAAAKTAAGDKLAAGANAAREQSPAAGAGSATDKGTEAPAPKPAEEKGFWARLRAKLGF